MVTPIVNLENFTKELMQRVQLKTNQSSSSEKVLLDGFKYYDLNQTGQASLKSFTQVVKIKMGLSSWTDENLADVFKELAGPSHSINYRELIGKLFGSQMNLSLKETAQVRDQSHHIRDKNDLIFNEELLKKNIDYIVYKLRNGKLDSFFCVFKELKKAQVSENKISQSAFTMVLKKMSIEISSEEIQRVFFFLAEDKSLISIDKFFDLLVRNFTAERKRHVSNAFKRFDYMVTGKVSLQLIKELFNSKNAYWTKEGRLGENETTAQFSDLLNGFSKFNENNFIVDFDKFQMLFSFISAYVKEDKEFAYFVENSFKYGELPQPQTSSASNVKTNMMKIDNLSIRTSQFEDLMVVLVDQLSQKGNKSFISFYKSLKCNDHDSDGFIFEKEFERSIFEMRIQFNQKQISRLYEKVGLQKLRLDYHELMKKMIPKFDGFRLKLIQQLWELLSSNKANEVSFDKIVSSFSARNHPDFKNGNKPDYELKTEFAEALQTFLNVIQGSFVTCSEELLVRFFEFFGRNWSDSYFQSVIEFAFKISRNESTRYSEINAPYGTNLEVNSQKKQPSVVSQRSEPPQIPASSFQTKFYQEFSNKKIFGSNNIYESMKEDFAKKSNEKSDKNPYYEEVQNENIKADKSERRKSIADVEESLPEEKGPLNWLVSNVNYANKSNGNQSDSDSKKPQSSATWNKNKEMVHRQFIDDKVEEYRRSDDQSKDFKNHIHSPEEGSVIAKGKKQNLKELNSQIANSQLNIIKPVNSEFPLEKFQSNLRFVGKIWMILQLEFDLTALSDDKGFIDFELFAATLDKHELTKGMKEEEVQALFLSNVVSGNKIHVQNLANKVRGQMTQHREKEMIKVFDRISGGKPEISVSVLKSSFLPQKFRFHIYKTMTDAKDMFSLLVDLFFKLNIAIKNKDSANLDDFLYLSDNFSFFISAEDEFVRLMNQSFK
jgi:hypothetical protein